MRLIDAEKQSHTYQDKSNERGKEITNNETWKPIRRLY